MSQTLVISMHVWQNSLGQKFNPCQYKVSTIIICDSLMANCKVIIRTQRLIKGVELEEPPVETCLRKLEISCQLFASTTSTKVLFLPVTTILEGMSMTGQHCRESISSAQHCTAEADQHSAMACTSQYGKRQASRWICLQERTMREKKHDFLL